MKKVFAILMTAAALAACAREEQPQNETPAPSESPTTYTLTVKASKGTDTRALVLNDNTLNAIWDGTEKVYAYLNDEEVEMTVDVSGQQSDRKDCILKGTFNQRPEAGNVLTLKLNKDEYMNQDGTLAYIGSNCDYAIATLTVSGVTDGQIETTPTTASFVNQQAIVKFSLEGESGAISPSTFTVKSNGTEVATVTGINANSNGVLFVAIPPISNGTIDLAATVSSDTYTYTRAGVTFSAGEYYSITVKMAKKTARIVNLSEESLYSNGGLFTALDGDVLTGIFPDDGWSRRIRIADGATVTLRDVTIVNQSFGYPALTLNGSATIILEGNGDNTVNSNSNHAGISIGGSGSTLTITGNGSLKAISQYGAAGIGSESASAGSTVSCGNIIINGGNVEATGGTGAAGIGCGFANGGTVSCGDITINAPAQVTAKKGNGAPYDIGPSNGGQCGTVTIYGTVYEPGWNSQ